MKNNSEILDFIKLKEVYNDILDLYPFLNKKEKNQFISKSDKIIKNEKLFIKNPVGQVDKMLNILKNPHALIQKIKSKKNKNIKYFEHKIKNNILYIKIPKWTSKTKEIAEKEADKIIKILISQQNKYKGVLFDVRDNTGGHSSGSHKIAGLFFKKPVIYGKIFKKRNGVFGYKNVKVFPSNKKYIDKPVSILINSKCFSSNELFIAPFKISKRATIIGERTKGGSANPKMRWVNYGRKRYLIRVPTWRIFLKNESKPLEETAIKPDIKYSEADIVDYAIKRF